MSRHVVRDRNAAVFGAIVRRRATLGRIFSRKAIKSRCSGLAVSSAGQVPTGRHFRKIKTLVRGSGIVAGASSRAEAQSPIIIRIDSSQTQAQVDGADDRPVTHLGIRPICEPIKPWAPGRSAHRRHSGVRIIRRAPASSEASTGTLQGASKAGPPKKAQARRGRKPRVKKVKVIRINSFRPMDGIDPVTGKPTNFLKREHPTKQTSEPSGAGGLLNARAVIVLRFQHIKRSARRGIVAGHRLARPGKTWMEQTPSLRLPPRSLALPIRVLAKMRRAARAVPAEPVRHTPQPIVQPEAVEEMPVLPELTPAKPSQEKPAASLVTRLKALDAVEDRGDVFSQSPTDLAPLRIEEALPQDESSPMEALAGRFKGVGRATRRDQALGEAGKEEATAPLLKRVAEQAKAFESSVKGRLSSLWDGTSSTDGGGIKSEELDDHGRAPHDADKAHAALNRWFELGPQVAKARVPRS